MSPAQTSTVLAFRAPEADRVAANPITVQQISSQRRDINQWLPWYIPLDMAALLTGFLLAWILAGIINYTLFGRILVNPLSENGSLRLGEFLLLAAGVLMWFEHTAHYRVRLPFWVEAQKIVSALAFAMMADGFLQFAAKHDFSRLWLMSGWLLAAMLIIAFRSVFRARLRTQGRLQVRTLLIGGGELALHTRAALDSEPGLGHEVVTQVEDLAAAFRRAGESWETLCVMMNADYVMVALDGLELAAAQVPLAQLARESVPFSVSPPLAHLPVMGMVPQYFFNHDVMLLARSSGLEQPMPRLLKRLMDLAVSATVLAMLSPLMLAIAFKIRQDGGPALYGHSRLGRNGKIFSCLKFRSMVLNGDEVLEHHLAQNQAAREEWHASRKLQHDPRVTRLGDFLRRSSLDELPQLINVLRGDMSLVGPRPIVTAEVDKYQGDIAHYYRVRPGVTGLWQVSGRSNVSYPQRVHMDSWYVRNWSLWNDIAILCKTFPALLKRSGAY